jgi:hypothetical protein
VSVLPLGAEPSFVRWLRAESQRERLEWLPWHPPAGAPTAAGADVRDPDRLVVFDDVAPYLVEVPRPAQPALYRMMLSLFGLPLSVASPAGATSTDVAVADPATLPTALPAFAWASLLQRPRLAPAALPLDPDVLFPPPGAYPAVASVPGAITVEPTSATLLWATSAAPGLGVHACPHGQLTDDQVGLVRYVAVDVPVGGAAHALIRCGGGVGALRADHADVSSWTRACRPGRPTVMMA